MENRQLKSLIYEFLVLSVLMLLTPLAILVDIAFLKNELSEISITEFKQAFFILISAIIFYKASSKKIESKGLFILVSGFFTIMFIRELDNFLDVIFHGFWKVPVTLVLGITLYFANINRTTILQPLVTHNQSKEFTYLFIGLMVVMIFSRIFGTGSLWQSIMADNYHRIQKRVIQEGLELFGYSLLLYGSILLHLKLNNKLTNNKKWL